MTGRLFGTTGVRKVYGREFDVEMALRLGKAFGTYLGGGTVLLARDARTTGLAIESALAAGILSTGVNVVRAGMIPTPTLAFVTRLYGLSAGVMVTASHNPPEYTGVKFWQGDSMGYPPEEERKIEGIYNSGEFRIAPWNALGAESTLHTAPEDHMREILSRTNVAEIERRKFKVVVDPGNGAASVLTPYLVRRLGCDVVSLNSQPDGHFPGRPSEPDESTLGGLVDTVRSTGADLGVAHDGDSDRVVFVTEKGEVVRGDRIIALLAREMLRTAGGGTIVTTVDSSRVLDETVEKAGGQTVRTPVGDIQVALKVKETGALMGGEACGVFIFPEFHLAPEPFLAVCRILELMARSENSLGELVATIPVYPLLKSKVPCANEDKERVMSRLAEVAPSELGDVQDVLTVDGLGLMLPDGWVLIRPSGTEPVVRVTCEAMSESRVSAVMEQATALVKDVVDGVR